MDKAGADQGDKTLVEIVMAGFQTLNNSIASLMQHEPTPNAAEVGVDSLEYSKLAKNYASIDLVGQEIHADLAKLVDNLLSE